MNIEMIIEIDDWVSFYSNGKIVIGQVRYLLKDRISGYVQVCTDIGMVKKDSILEVRSPVKY